MARSESSPNPSRVQLTMLPGRVRSLISYLPGTSFRRQAETRMIHIGVTMQAWGWRRGEEGKTVM